MTTQIDSVAWVVSYGYLEEDEQQGRPPRWRIGLPRNGVTCVLPFPFNSKLEAERVCREMNRVYSKWSDAKKDGAVKVMQFMAENLPW